VLAQLRDVIVPRTSDPLAQVREKSTARLIKYLARADVYGAACEEDERSDLAVMLGSRPDSVASGRAAAAEAVAAGSVCDEDYVVLLWRRIARQTELARPAMGALADRHWPELA
jgi:hypothetical protein